MSATTEGPLLPCDASAAAGRLRLIPRVIDPDPPPRAAFASWPRMLLSASSSDGASAALALSRSRCAATSLACTDAPLGGLTTASKYLRETRYESELVLLVAVAAVAVRA